MTDEQPTSRREARESARKRTGAQKSAGSAEGAPVGPAEGASGGGIAALIRRHPTAWIVSAAALAFVLLGTGSVFAGVAWASRTAEPLPTPTPSVTTAEPRPVSTLEATASRLRTCSIASQAADGALAELSATIMRADTGELLFDRNGSASVAPASVLKVLTAATAIAVLGPDFQITTSVYEGSAPGTIVLVGRGDTTLSRLPVGQESTYAGAPKLQTLAEGVIAEYVKKHPDVPITQLVLDSSYWNASDAWDSTWREDQRTQGYQAPATALQVDGDRDDPRAAVSPRSTDPVARAGDWFLEALYAADTTGTVIDPDVTISLGSAVSETSESLLSEVSSQPIRTLLPQMLLPSDNMLGEMLARIASVESGMGGSAASLQATFVAQLAEWGFSATGVTIRDGSGLSPENAVPTSAITALMRFIRDGADGLDAVRDGLPVAGQSGTLASRFTGDNAVARGNVVAKSGMIRGSYTLSGIINAEDGTPLVFTFYAARDGVDSSARAALDTLTTAAYRCGDNLSNN